MGQILEKVMGYSTTFVYYFLPVIFVFRIVMIQMDMEENNSFISLFKSTITVILFNFLFDSFYPSIYNELLNSLSIFNSQMPGYNGEFSFLKFTISTYSSILSGMTFLLDSFNFIIAYTFLGIIGFAFPISFLLDRMLKFSMPWGLLKLLVVSIGLFSVITWFLTTKDGKLIEYTAYSDKELIFNFLKSFLVCLSLIIPLVVSFFLPGIMSSEGSKANQLMAMFKPGTYENKISKGLESGRYKLDSTGVARRRLSAEELNKSAAKKYKDKQIANILDKNGSMSSIKDAEKSLVYPISGKKEQENRTKRDTSVASIISKQGLTSYSEGVNALDNPISFNAVNQMKKQKENSLDKEISKMISSGESTSISEASQSLHYPISSGALRESRSNREKTLMDAVKNNKLESFGDANLYTENPTLFTEIQKNKTHNQQMKDSELANLIGSDVASDLREAQNKINYPTASLEQEKKFLRDQKIRDQNYSGVISKSKHTNFGDAKVEIEMPQSWKEIDRNREKKSRESIKKG